MLLKQFSNSVYLLRDRKFHETHQWPVGKVLDKYKFTEVLILGNQHATVAQGQFHEPPVTSAGINGQRGHDIMSLANKKGGQRPGRHAHIEQEFHVLTLAIRSWTCSPASDRCA